MLLVLFNKKVFLAANVDVVEVRVGSYVNMGCVVFGWNGQTMF
jgi:hypothetical protein